MDFLLRNKTVSDKKELNILFQKKITCWSEDISKCNIILTEPKYLPWFYQNFIHISSSEHIYDYLRLDYTLIPYKDVFSENASYGYDSLEPYENNITELIIDLINDGYYLIVYVDEFYLREENVCNRKHYVHETFVYGYDLADRKLLAYAFDKKQTLCKLEYNLDSFNEAFLDGKKHYQSSSPWCKDGAIRSFRLKPLNEIYPFNVSYFLDEVKKYLCSYEDTDTSTYYKEYNKNYKFGISIYDSVIDSLNPYTSGGFPIDLRGFHFLLEHKNGILERMEYVLSNYKLENDFACTIEKYSRLIVSEFSILRGKYMKQSLLESDFSNPFGPVQEEPFISSLIQKLKSLKSTEYELLSDFHEKLSAIASTLQ